MFCCCCFFRGGGGTRVNESSLQRIQIKNIYCFSFSAGGTGWGLEQVIFFTKNPNLKKKKNIFFCVCGGVLGRGLEYVNFLLLRIQIETKKKLGGLE